MEGVWMNMAEIDISLLDGSEQNWSENAWQCLNYTINLNATFEYLVLRFSQYYWECSLKLFFLAGNLVNKI